MGNDRYDLRLCYQLLLLTILLCGFLDGACTVRHWRPLLGRELPWRLHSCIAPSKKNLTLKIAPVDTPKTAFQILKIGLAPFGLTLAPNISLVIINRFSVYYANRSYRHLCLYLLYHSALFIFFCQGVG